MFVCLAGGCETTTTHKGFSSGYNYRKPGFSMGTGHFTQVGWKGSTKLGCGSAKCKGMTIWVCTYDPPGNMRGDFPDNVQKPCK